MNATSRSAVIAAASLAFTAAASASELRFSHMMPPDHYFDQDAKAWAEALREASGGEISVTIFPASQLGGAADQFDMARDGIADIAWVNWGYTPGAFPVLELLDLPFAIETDRATAARAVHNWYQPYSEAEMPDVKLCLAHVGPSGTFHSSVPITVPQDVSGLQVRPSGGAMAQYIADLGGSAVQVPAPEVRGAIERGVANAITFPWGSLKVFGISEAVQYHLDRDIYYVGAGLVMNKAKYDGLSDAAKAAVDTVCSAEWAERLGRTWVEFEAGGRAIVEAEGDHSVHELTEDEMEAWRVSTEPAYGRWAALVQSRGLDPEAIRTGLAEAIEAESNE